MSALGTDVMRTSPSVGRVPWKSLCMKLDWWLAERARRDDLRAYPRLSGGVASKQRALAWA